MTGSYFYKNLFVGAVVPFFLILFFQRTQLKWKAVIAGVYLIVLFASLGVCISREMAAAVSYKFDLWKTVGTFFQREWFWDRYGGMGSDDVVYSAELPLKLIRIAMGYLCLFKLFGDWWTYFVDRP